MNATKAVKRKSPKGEKSKTPSEHPLMNRVRNHLHRTYDHHKGTLRVKFLWTSGDTHRFRANWWEDDGHITTSLFLYVKEGMDGELSVTAV